MKILFDVDGCSESTSVALGFFDGIHKGHLNVINESKKNGLASCVFTFNVHPKNFFSHSKVEQIYSQEQKINILRSLDVDIVVFAPFEDVCNLNGFEFVEDVLIKKFNAKYITCGFNYNFGKDAALNVFDLKTICDSQNVILKVVNPVTINQDVVSSTKIRNLIKQGNIQDANNLLGRPFSYASKVTFLNSKTPMLINRFSNNTVIPERGRYKSFIMLDDNQIPATTLVFAKNETFLSETTPTLPIDVCIYNNKIAQVALIDKISP